MFWFSNSLYLKSPHPHAVHILSWDQDDTEQKGHMILVLVFLVCMYAFRYKRL